MTRLEDRGLRDHSFILLNPPNQKKIAIFINLKREKILLEIHKKKCYKLTRGNIMKNNIYTRYECNYFGRIPLPERLVH